MDRNEAIRIIETLYPADSNYEDTARIGQELLEQAKHTIDWRTEPTEVLIRYAKLCEAKELSIIRKLG